MFGFRDVYVFNTDFATNIAVQFCLSTFYLTK